MPHRIAELESIAAELSVLAKRATDIGELQLAKSLVDAIALSHAAKVRVASQLASGGTPDSKSTQSGG